MSAIKSIAEQLSAAGDTHYLAVRTAHAYAVRTSEQLWDADLWDALTGDIHAARIEIDEILDQARAAHGLIARAGGGA